jgi:hypothetical protein
MSKPYIVCPYCHSNLDYGERCDCQKTRADPDLSPTSVVDRRARPLIQKVAKAFEDPAVRAEYRQRTAQRQNGTNARS